MRNYIAQRKFDSPNQYRYFTLRIKQLPCIAKHKVILTTAIEPKVKVKVWTLVIALLTWVRFVTSSAFIHLGSGSWLAWANGTAAHYVAIHCPRWRTIIIIIIIKNECHSNIIVDRLQGCGHSKKLRESEIESRSSKVWQARCQL